VGITVSPALLNISHHDAVHIAGNTGAHLGDRSHRRPAAHADQQWWHALPHHRQEYPEWAAGRAGNGGASVGAMLAREGRAGRSGRNLELIEDVYQLD